MRLLAKCYLLLALLASATAYAAGTFVVKDIRVEGLQGISSDTVLSYMPIQPGQTFGPSDSAKVIHALYQTGFFNDVNLAQAGNTLIVKVVERPVITSIDVDGNKAIPKDKLNEVLKNLGLAQGRVFDASVLERVKHSLEDEYEHLGKYNAKVVTTVTPQPRNRVIIKIDITEGSTVQVKDIQIIGNKAFSTSKLVGQFSLTTHHLWSFITQGDRFSQEKFDASLEALRSYYMDRGYLRFKIDSAEHNLTPDRNYVSIVIHITEGPVYTVKGYQLVGNFVVPEPTLQKAVKIHSGDVFSRKAVQEASDAIGRLLGNVGYAFATVNFEPTIDDQNKQVFLTFYVEPGQRVYVRRINFSGNTKTEDVVLRRALPQMEGGLVSVDSIKESERQLNLLGYLENIQVQTQPVPGAPDHVDLNYSVNEAPSAQAIVGVGYGTDGLLLNAGINQNNFMGTGKTVGVNASTTRYITSYNFNYNNPYYTKDGVQRGFNVYVQRVTPGNVNIATYTTSVYGATINYSIPISASGDYLQLGYGYQYTSLSLGGTPSVQLSTFVQENGSNFKQVLLTSGWTRNGLDRAVFPTQGISQALALQVSLPGGGQPLDYYKASYNFNYYHPLTSRGFIATARGAFGYGDGFGSSHGLPFFANYYAGGPAGYFGQVRGYSSNSLGPRDSNNQPLGGNILTSATVGIIFPNPISPDKLRTTAFVDAGNVYTQLSQARGGSGAGPLRYSAGISADWRVPVLNCMLDLSLARAINPQPADQLEFFQFNIGTSF